MFFIVQFTIHLEDGDSVSLRNVGRKGLRGLSLRANYTVRATAACRQS
jgi:hypothetical protein